MSSRSMNMIWLRLGGVQGVAEPVAGGFGDFTAGDDERVVDEDAFVVFGVEYLVGQHHQCLVVDFGDVGVTGLGDSGGVEFALLDLDSEVEPVLGGQGVAHPDVLAVFERLVLVPGGGDAVETQLAKQREEDFFDEFVLAAVVEVGGKLGAALVFGGGEWPMRVGL